MTAFASPNYTQCPNDLFDVLMSQMGEAELRVVMAVVRLTVGFHRDRARASLTTIAGMTGLSRQSVLAGAAAAEQRGLITRSRHTQPGAGGDVTQWTINILDAAPHRPTRPALHTAQPPDAEDEPSAPVNPVDQPQPPLVKLVDQAEPPLVKPVDQPEPPLVKPVDQAEPPLVKLVDQTGQASRPPSIKESIKKEISPLARRAPAKHRQTYSAAVEYAWARLAPINQVQREAIDRAVLNLDLWQRCVDAWRLAGYKPTNITGVLDWYAHGGPPSRAAPLRSALRTRHTPDPTDEEIAALAREYPNAILSRHH